MSSLQTACELHLLPPAFLEDSWRGRETTAHRGLEVLALSPAPPGWFSSRASHLHVTCFSPVKQRAILHAEDVLFYLCYCDGWLSWNGLQSYWSREQKLYSPINIKAWSIANFFNSSNRRKLPLFETFTSSLWNGAHSQSCNEWKVVWHLWWRRAQMCFSLFMWRIFYKFQFCSLFISHVIQVCFH